VVVLVGSSWISDRYRRLYRLLKGVEKSALLSIGRTSAARLEALFSSAAASSP
jgi:hypothetical protein